MPAVSAATGPVAVMGHDPEHEWVPPTLDTARPNVARMYDYYLGGKDHFAVDREAAELTLAVLPEVRDVCLANRRFLVGAVAAAARAGIRQFVDLGTGIPTRPSVHETARAVHPDAAVVYVDNDPVVVAHNRALLCDDAGVATVRGDLRDPDAVLGDPEVQQVVDLSRPVMVMLIAVLHFVDLKAAPGVVARLARDLAPGSRVAISAAASDGVDEQVRHRVEEIYAAANAPFVYRTRAEFRALFGGLELEPPGVVELLRTPSACGVAAVASVR